MENGKRRKLDESYTGKRMYHRKEKMVNSCPSANRFMLSSGATASYSHMMHQMNQNDLFSCEGMDSRHFSTIKHVVRSLFVDGTSSSLPKAGLKSQAVGAQSNKAHGKQQPTENELLVNEIVHGGQSTPVDKEEASIKTKVRETMGKTFWDGIMDSMKEDSPDYSRILGLVKEARDKLIGMAHKSWKQEILDSIDMDIFSQGRTIMSMDLLIKESYTPKPGYDKATRVEKIQKTQRWQLEGKEQHSCSLPHGSLLLSALSSSSSLSWLNASSTILGSFLRKRIRSCCSKSS